MGGQIEEKVYIFSGNPLECKYHSISDVAMLYLPLNSNHTHCNMFCGNRHHFSGVVIVYCSFLIIVFILYL